MLRRNSEAIMSKAISAQSLTKYSKVLEAIGDNMKTDLTFSQMKVYLSYFLTHSDISIESIQLQGTDSIINDVYYYKLDEAELETTKYNLQAHLKETVLVDEE